MGASQHYSRIQGVFTGKSTHCENRGPKLMIEQMQTVSYGFFEGWAVQYECENVHLRKIYFDEISKEVVWWEMLRSRQF